MPFTLADAYEAAGFARCPPMPLGVTQPPAPGSKVQVVGKVTAVAKKCKDKSAAGVVTFRKVVFALPSSDETKQDETKQGD